MENIEKIKELIPCFIFQKPNFRKQLDDLFKSAEEKIKAKINEIKSRINLNFSRPSNYDNVETYFVEYFYEFILDKANNITPPADAEYDILAIIFDLLSEKNLDAAISGKPMIDAFTKSISDEPTKNRYELYVKNAKMFFLQKKFIQKNPNH